MGVWNAPLPDAAAARAARLVSARPYAVVFDGHCQVCARISAMLESLDTRHQLEILSSETTGILERFPWISAQAYADALQVVADDGTTWQGAAAVEQLIRVLPRGRWIAWIFHVPFVRPLADRCYVWFARNRYRLGCGDHCRLH